MQVINVGILHLLPVEDVYIHTKAAHLLSVHVIVMFPWFDSRSGVALLHVFLFNEIFITLLFGVHIPVVLSCTYLQPS